MTLVDAIVELYRKTATELPEDVSRAIASARDNEDSEVSRSIMQTIIDNISLAREKSLPLCQDTGTPIFYVECDGNEDSIREAIIEATRIATKKVPLRPNCVDSLTGKNTGDNAGLNMPVIKFSKGSRTVISLMLKGGGSENIGMQYKLPDARLNAGRDLEGVKKCIADAVYAAQGKGCPPTIAGAGIG